jgi:hypothetical protein
MHQTQGLKNEHNLTSLCFTSVYVKTEKTALFAMLQGFVLLLSFAMLASFGRAFTLSSRSCSLSTQQFRRSMSVQMKDGGVGNMNVKQFDAILKGDSRSVRRPFP